MTAIEFSERGDRLTAASSDGTLTFWDTRELNNVTLLGRFTAQNPINSLSTSLDSKDSTPERVAFATSENVVLLDFDLNTVLERGCHWLDDYLTNNPEGIEIASEYSICESF